MEKTARPARIVIVGAGFAGVYAYLGLHKRLHGSGAAEITLVSQNDRFTFIPMIHEVATGSLQPGSVTQPLRTLPQCCLTNFVEGTLIEVRHKKKEIVVSYRDLVSTDRDEHIPARNAKTISYDYLVLALGSKTNFFGVPGAAEYALPLKTLADAVRLKNNILERFQEATRSPDPEERKVLLRFVIVGGGPTGVEIAGELSDIVSNELSRAFPELAEYASIVIVDRSERLVSGVDPWFGEHVDTILHKKHGVYIMHGTSVERVSSDGAHTNTGMIHARTVVWAGGVSGESVSFPDGEPERDERTGRIKTTNHLHLPDLSEVFVAGDLAWVCDKETGQPYPMRAQFAVRAGETVAANISARLTGQAPAEFSFRERGFILSLGKGGSLAEVFGVRVSGIVGWFVYRVAYLTAIVGARAKLRTALEWMLNLFLPRDIGKL